MKKFREYLNAVRRTTYNKINLEKRKLAAFAVFHNMKKCGIESDIMLSETKVGLFKTITQPLIYFGMENLRTTINSTKESRTTFQQRWKPTLRISLVIDSLLNSSFLMRLFSNSLNKPNCEYGKLVIA
ncbi:hypothetical protein BpHYR1_028774 [Brachionus plicatilis]|uniref:Uncharacterized protein n=1 Tax=Brachionus plicatilis TaxID=10195 RepID=A0A3M7RS87_BRAPC|nr:hypothetical protein BpHYR1_028774 [Brachionus plicatilis]